MSRATHAGAGRWVIKIGGALLTAGGAGLDMAAINAWVAQLVRLRAQGRQVVVVSSGAVAEGMRRLGWERRPEAIHELQAAAAVGQMGLVQAWESCFQTHGVHTAQVLLTHDDLADRRRYLNARSTLRTLLDLGVVPIVNENDTVAFDELRFGDNDTLGGLVANLVEAKLLVLLTDRDAMYDADPAQNPAAQRLATAHTADPALDAMAGPSGGQLGRGGMQTKLRAARLAARSGAATWIVGGAIDNVLTELANGADIGTLLIPEQEPLQARKLWLAGNLRVRGRLHIDAGAEQVLRQAGRSLLAVGVTAVEGDFRRGDLVACVTADGREVARGLCNYGAEETRQIKGLPSSRFAEVLGYVDEPELVHRDNLVLT